MAQCGPCTAAAANAVVAALAATAATAAVIAVTGSGAAFVPAVVARSEMHAWDAVCHFYE